MNDLGRKLGNLIFNSVDPMLILLFNKRKIIYINNFLVLFFFEPLGLTENQIFSPKSHNNDKESSFICPYKGKVIAKEKNFVFGFPLPHNRVLCMIDVNRNVISRDNSRGWINNSGQIRKGFKEYSNSIIEPEIAGKIVDNLLFLMSIKVGKLVKPKEFPLHYV